MVSAVRGGRKRRKSTPGGGGRGRVAGDGFVGTEPPHFDSAGEEGEEEAADPPVRLDPLGDDRSYDGELGKRAAMEELGWGRERSRRGRAEGENGQGSRWRTHGARPRSRRHSIDGWGRRHGRTAWRQWPWWHCGEEEEKLRENPLAQNLAIAKRSSSNFNDLKEAPGYFYKMCKNSYKLYLTFKTSTKICEAK